MSGGKCPNISGLMFDRESQEGLKRIKRDILRLTVLSIIFSTGTMYSIFRKLTLPSVAISISKNDWEIFAEGMSTISKLQRRAIEFEAIKQANRHSSDAKQRQFWEAVLNGCWEK
ncbi:MAG: hypothetical protein L3J00_06205 [Thiomicrorhabdus sp.]|nr:hypothetical protein [Thiomicrorhabdus sp.]